MKIARFMVTPEFLRQRMNLPLTANLERAGFDAMSGNFVFVVTDPDLPDVQLLEGDDPPLVTPMLRKQPRIVFEGWNP